MNKKESYRHILPHFQQPGQAYFVTWNLKDAVPPKALERYTQQLESLAAKISGAAIFDRGNLPQLQTVSFKLKQEYYLVRKNTSKPTTICWTLPVARQLTCQEQKMLKLCSGL